MGYDYIEYKEDSFLENEGIVSWVQRYLASQLALHMPNDEWMKEMSEVLYGSSYTNSMTFLFSTEELTTREKELWAIEFLETSISEMKGMSIKKFLSIIEEDDIICGMIPWMISILERHKAQIESQLWPEDHQPEDVG